MAFAGILNDADITAALDACKGEAFILNPTLISSYLVYGYIQFECDEKMNIKSKHNDCTKKLFLQDYFKDETFCIHILTAQTHRKDK